MPKYPKTALQAAMRRQKKGTRITDPLVPGGAGSKRGTLQAKGNLSIDGKANKHFGGPLRGQWTRTPYGKGPAHKRFPGDGQTEDDAINPKTGRPMWDDKAKGKARGLGSISGKADKKFGATSAKFPRGMRANAVANIAVGRARAARSK